MDKSRNSRQSASFLHGEVSILKESGLNQPPCTMSVKSVPLLGKMYVKFEIFCIVLLCSGREKLGKLCKGRDASFPCTSYTIWCSHFGLCSSWWRSFKFSQCWSGNLHFSWRANRQPGSNGKTQSFGLSGCRTLTCWDAMWYHGPVHQCHGQAGKCSANWLQVIIAKPFPPTMVNLEKII